MTALKRMIIDKLPSIAADVMPCGDFIFDSESTGAANQCVLFLKPEATAIASGVDLEGIVQLTLTALSAHNVDVRKVRVLNGAATLKPVRGG